MKGSIVVATIDFHVTSECSQECPYCWGPQLDSACDSSVAAAIVRKIAGSGARRIVFTGGDPILREDIGMLIRLAKQEKLEVALSTTGDHLSEGFLRGYGSWIDLISLPIDGSSEEISSKTKKPGHLAAVLSSLEMLGSFPDIDVKAATPVTRYNINDVPAIIQLLTRIAERLDNRFFYNVFQAFPRSMNPQEWDDLVVTDDEFNSLRSSINESNVPFKINWLSHEILDRLYVMVFPDGSLRIPSGSSYPDYGPFLDIKDLDAFLSETDFDARKHAHHAKGWQKEA